MQFISKNVTSSSVQTARCAIWNVRRGTVGYFRDAPLELMHHGLWLIQQHYNDADTPFIMTGYSADLGHDVLERERWHYLSCDYHTEDTISADEASTKAETLTRVFDMLRGWDVFQMLQFVAPNERGGENKQIKVCFACLIRLQN
jgi:hypothetical protein